MAKYGAGGGAEWDRAVVVALGSNLSGGRESSSDLLEQALARLPQAGLEVRRRSRFWRSAAWPDAREPDYINAVALVETRRAPRAALAALQAVEAEFGRTRERPNAPRTLDLDLIAHGRVVCEAPHLILPHPRAAERLFVMGPLAEIAPGWRHPVLGATAAELASRAIVARDAVPLD